MAISLLTVLIALGLLHLRPQLARWGGDRPFRQWVRQLGDTSGAGRVVLALLLPLALCAAVAWLLGRLPLGELWQMLFALAVLLYAFTRANSRRTWKRSCRPPTGCSAKPRRRR